MKEQTITQSVIISINQILAKEYLGKIETYNCKRYYPVKRSPLQGSDLATKRPKNAKMSKAAPK